MAKNQLFRAPAARRRCPLLGGFPAHRDRDGLAGRRRRRRRRSPAAGEVDRHLPGGRPAPRPRRPALQDRGRAHRHAAGVPLVPVAIRGTDGWRQRLRWSIAVGEPICSAARGPRARRRAAAQRRAGSGRRSRRSRRRSTRRPRSGSAGEAALADEAPAADEAPLRDEQHRQRGARPQPEPLAPLLLRAAERRPPAEAPAVARVGALLAVGGDRRRARRGRSSATSATGPVRARAPASRTSSSALRPRRSSPCSCSRRRRTRGRDDGALPLLRASRRVPASDRLVGRPRTRRCCRSSRRRVGERVSLQAIKVYLGVAGTVIGLVGSDLLVHRVGFRAMALVIAALALVCQYVAIGGVWERAKLSRQHRPGPRLPRGAAGDVPRTGRSGCSCRASSCSRSPSSCCRRTSRSTPMPSSARTAGSASTLLLAVAIARGARRACRCSRCLAPPHLEAAAYRALDARRRLHVPAARRRGPPARDPGRGRRSSSRSR